VEFTKRMPPSECTSLAVIALPLDFDQPMELEAICYQICECDVSRRSERCTWYNLISWSSSL